MELTTSKQGPISTEQKLEVIDWIVTKFVVRDIDAWENDATLHFPTFFVQFSEVTELDDPYRALYNAMVADKQSPITIEEQEHYKRVYLDTFHREKQKDEVAEKH